MVVLGDAIPPLRSQPLVIKNTFLVCDDEVDTDDEGCAPQRRASSAPPLSRSESDWSSESECQTSRASELEVSPLASAASPGALAAADEGAGIGACEPPGRVSLKAGAKLWQPAVCALASIAVAAPAPTGLGDVTAVVNAALKKLRSMEAVCTTDLKTHTGGWDLTATLRPAFSESGPQVLATMQASVLTASQRSACTYVLGYSSNAFMPLRNELGCACTLATVQDENTACWDLLTKGYCARGHLCRWSHPTFQATLTIRIS